MSGAVAKNAGRFKGRKGPKRIRPLGEPYANMSEGEQEVWGELARDMPWLHSGHRIMVRMVCHHAARLNSGEEFGTKATTALSSLLSKLGATPTDETKVSHTDEPDDEPEDRFFARPN